MKRLMMLVFISCFVMTFSACNKKAAPENTAGAGAETVEAKAKEAEKASPEAEKASPEAEKASPEAEKASPEAVKPDAEADSAAEANAEADVKAIKPNEKFNLKTPISGLKPGGKCEVPDGFCEELMEDGATLIAWRKAFKRTTTGEVTDEEIEKAIPGLIPRHKPKNVRFTLSEPLSETLNRPAWSVAFETGGNEDTRFVKASLTADDHYLYAYVISRSEFSSIEDVTVTNALLNLVF